MTLSHFSFYRQYVASPITKLHLLNTFLKLYLIYIYLIILPYCTLLSLCITSIVLIILITYNKLLKIIIFKFSKYFYYLICYLLLSLLVNRNFYVIRKNYNIMIYFMPLTISIQHSNSIMRIILRYKILIFPDFILRIILIKCIYIILINIIFITTKYESIIVILFSHFSIPNTLKNKNLHLIVILGLHLLERITYNIKNIYLSVQLNYDNGFFLFFKIEIYKIIVTTFILNLWNDIYKISTILWSRKISNRQLYL